MIHSELKARVTTLLIFFLLSTPSLFSQNVLNGFLISKKDRKPIQDGYVLLKQNGKTIQTTASDKKGAYEMQNIQNGKYVVEVVCLGYKELRDTLDIHGSTQLKLELEEMAKTLDEVTVVGDRSQIVKRTANGQIFYLSSNAKKEHNPFMALQEIPAIISDPNTSTVKMANGDSPLILINGNMVNSGISPISPSDIESVEVVNAVSARYQQDGVTSIVNIKLKKHAHPYIWLEGATRHDIPANNGFGVGYFEVGNTKISLYGRAAYNYTYHDDVRNDVNRTNTGYSQNYSQSIRNNGGKWIGELLLKYQITDKDYFAAQVYDSYKTDKEKSDASGSYVSDAPQTYSFNSFGKNNSNILTSSMYYKHSFATDNDLELRLAYNFNKNDYNAERTDYYGLQPTNTDIRYHNKRHSLNFYIDYSKTFRNNSSMIAGSRSSFVSDHIDDVVGTNPLFKHTNYNQYLYVGYGGTFKKIYYGLSAGLEGIWAKAGDVSYSYFRPRGNANATWVVNDHNSIRLSYSLRHTAPSVTYLNPYNTSTDSLLVSIGNPHLKPQMTHALSLSYTLNVGHLYLTPSASYNYVYDVIENGGYSKGNVYYSTYANTGHFSELAAGANASYRFKWGRIYAGGGWGAEYFMGQDAKNYAFASCGFNARAKKFSFYGDFEYNSRDYSALSRTIYYQPTMANLQVNYNFTPDFYIALCVQHVTGEYNTKTTTRNGAYYAVTRTHYKDKDFRPWILLRYTFRKNVNQRHKLDNVLNSEEEGINIVRKQ